MVAFSLQRLLKQSLAACTASLQFIQWPEEGTTAVRAPVGDYGGGMMFSVVVTCLMAASCGLIFSYDSGISGAYSASAGCSRAQIAP